MRKLAVVVIVLLVVLLAADRGGAWLAGRVAGDALRDSQGLSERPDVDVRGFPFLTQLASGRFDRVDVAADTVPLGDSGLELARLDVELRDLTRDGSAVTAERARAQGLLGFADLAEAVGGGVRFSEADGALRAVAPLDVAGRGVDVTAVVRPEVVDGALRLANFTLRGVDDPGGALSRALDAVLGTRLPLDGVPFDVRVQDVEVQDDGVLLTLSGRDLRYGG